MSLNKEMIFGLAFGDDNMKWPIVDKPPTKTENIMRNTTYTLEKDVMLEYYGFKSDRKIAANKELRTEMYAFIKPLSEEAANNRVTIARLEEQIKCAGEKAELREQVIQGQLREQGLALNGKIDQVASAAKCCCEANSAAIASLQALVGKITQTNVPLSAICPEVMARYNSWTAPTTTPAA